MRLFDLPKDILVDLVLSLLDPLDIVMFRCAFVEFSPLVVANRRHLRSFDKEVFILGEPQKSNFENHPTHFVRFNKYPCFNKLFLENPPVTPETLRREVQFTVDGNSFKCVESTRPTYGNLVFIFQPLFLVGCQSALQTLLNFLYPHLKMPHLATNWATMSLKIWPKTLEGIIGFSLFVEEHTKFAETRCLGKQILGFIDCIPSFTTLYINTRCAIDITDFQNDVANLKFLELDCPNVTFTSIPWKMFTVAGMSIDSSPIHDLLKNTRRTAIGSTRQRLRFVTNCEPRGTKLSRMVAITNGMYSSSVAIWDW